MIEESEEICSVLGTFLHVWNDDLSRAERKAFLRPLIPRLIGTRGSRALETKRAMMATDWLVRVHAPAWLRLAGLTAQADTLASLPELVDMAQAVGIRGILEAVSNDAAAAMAAPSDEALDAAHAAVSAAAVSAAADTVSWDAARAEDAAGPGDVVATMAAGTAAMAAGTAARHASGAAAWNTAEAALKATKKAMQRSALDLVNRMIDAR